MKQQTNAHDRLFKESMRHPEIARDWFRSHVPEEIWSRVDLNSFCLMDKEFTVTHDRELRSDILYRVKLIDSEQYVYFIVEHQSRPERFLPLRFAEYALAAMTQYRGKGDKYAPLVFVFCIYHGKVGPYPFSTKTIDCFPEKYRELAGSLLFFKFYLVDLTRRSSESINEDGLASPFQHLLKCSYMTNQLEFLKGAQLGPKVEALEVTLKGAETYLNDCARYVVNELGEGKPGDVDEGLAILSTIFPPTLKGDIMTFARQLRIRGREEGIQEGIQKGILKGKEEGEKKTLEHVAQAMVANGFSIEQIANVTQLPIEKLQQILIQ